ncbi:hypothetical protein QFZ75_001777 [Streptomyces sp. V3I8]|nr:hypothetical protein [Streptomyces sp. V3I8]
MNSLSSTLSQDMYALSDWSCLATQRQPSWQLLSSHSASAGAVEYCRCTCDALVVLYKGELVAFTGPRHAYELVHGKR